MKTIAIYSPISGHGHLDSWFLEFTQIFLDANWRVIAINPSQQLLSKISKLNNNKLNCIHSLSSQVINLNEETNKNKLVNIWKKINSAGLQSLMTPKNISVQKTKWKIDKYKIYFYLPFHLFRYYFLHVFKKKIIKKKLNCDLRKNLLEIENLISSNGFSPSLIFHMYLDGFDVSNDFLKNSIEKTKFKWVGLRFFPTKEDSQFQNMFSGLAYLNALKNNSFTESEGCKTIFLPDVAHTLLDTSKVSHQEIRARAGSRKIVLLAGIIDARKNIKLWLEIIKHADPSEWYFLQIGEIDFKQLSIIDYFKIYSLLIDTPENLSIIPRFFDEEDHFNNYFSLADIIFAVYKDFKYSSGILSKASAFHKPILVSNKYQMGDFVNKYQLGCSTDEDNVISAMKALEKISKDNFPACNFESYNELNSKDLLKFKLTSFCVDVEKGD